MKNFIVYMIVAALASNGLFAAETERLQLDVPPASVKAGFGTSEEQIKALILVNALRESPDNLLQKLSQCQMGTPKPKHIVNECTRILRLTKQLMDEFKANRNKVDFDRLMRSIELSVLTEDSLPAQREYE